MALWAEGCVQCTEPWSARCICFQERLTTICWNTPGLDIHTIASCRVPTRLPGVLPTFRFARLAGNVPGLTIPTGLTVGHIALDSSGVAGYTCKLCTLSWRLGHVPKGGRLGPVGKKAKSAICVHGSSQPELVDVISLLRASALRYPEFVEPLSEL